MKTLNIKKLNLNNSDDNNAFNTNTKEMDHICLEKTLIPDIKEKIKIKSKKIIKYDINDLTSDDGKMTKSKSKKANTIIDFMTDDELTGELSENKLKPKSIIKSKNLIVDEPIIVKKNKSKIV